MSKKKAGKQEEKEAQASMNGHTDEAVKEQVSEEEAAPKENEAASEEKADSAEQTKTEEEQEDYKDRYLRLYAEFENFRKRTSRERLELFSSANQELMTALLPVLDDFERAAKQLPKDESAKAFVEGLELIRDKFQKTLVNKGLKSLDIQVGEEFDVDRMEAITKIPAPEDKLKGKVVDVIEQGYKLGEKIIRYARVVVGE